MQAVVNLEAVRRAIKSIEAEGGKPTARAILAQTGGSMATVLRLLKEAQEVEAAASCYDDALPDTLLDAIRAALGTTRQECQEAAGVRVAEAEVRETAAVEALAGSEAQIEASAKEIATLREQVVSLEGEVEKQAAIYNEASASSKQRIAELETERKQLVEAGEAARTEAAKAMLQLERADRTAALAEQRVTDLLAQIDDVKQARTDAEKQAAVAVATAEAAGEVKAELRERIREMERAAEVAAKEIERLQRALTEAVQGRQE
jgi:chromosome segregation ATPase